MIEVGDKEVVLRFDNTGDHVERIVHMGAEHPANLQPSLHGHSIGRWEGETLVIDTIGFEPNGSGVALNVPSSASKHTVERLTLTEDRAARALRGNCRRLDVSVGAGHVDAAVGPPPGPRVFAEHGGVRSRGCE